MTQTLFVVRPPFARMIAGQNCARHDERVTNVSHCSPASREIVLGCFKDASADGSYNPQRPETVIEAHPACIGPSVDCP